MVFDSPGDRIAGPEPPGNRGLFFLRSRGVHPLWFHPPIEIPAALQIDAGACERGLGEEFNETLSPALPIRTNLTLIIRTNGHGSLCVRFPG
jgi:hypothetical protein